MRRAVWLALGAAVGAVTAAEAVLKFAAPKEKQRPEAPLVVERMREVARLEVLDVEVYKKIDYRPEPPAPTESTLNNVWNWADYNLHDPHGRAIVFATVHLGIDLHALDSNHVAVNGDIVELAIPQIEARVELRPGETEVINSNLNAAQTAQLLGEAKDAISHDAARDQALRTREGQATERALRALVQALGFRDLRLVKAVAAQPRA